MSEEQNLLEEAVIMLETVEQAVGLIMVVKGERDAWEATGYPAQMRDIINRHREAADGE